MHSHWVNKYWVALVCVFFAAPVFAVEDTEMDAAEEAEIAAAEEASLVAQGVYEPKSVYAPKKDYVKKFDNLFSIRLLTNYNYMGFSSSQYDGGTIRSNRPVDIGLGLGISDITFDIKYSLPFTAGATKRRSAAFDTGLDFFPKNLWLQFKYRRYSGLISAEEKNDADSLVQDSTRRYPDIRQRDMYLSFLWVKAGKDQFSVRAPYFLDRIQLISAGSPVFGGKLQSSYMVDRSKAIEFYSKTRNIYSVWAHGGYSYTWVLEHNFFLNVWALGGLAVGAFGNSGFGFFPEFNGKLAIGQWHQGWSWNVVPQITYSTLMTSNYTDQRLLGSFEILVVKRF
ncbi:MAG: DUF4421 domain-containing protein [Fibrobacter sp.]|nr:DUF4421 domain-containing protein [Fibrobacter sp.]